MANAAGLKRVADVTSEDGALRSPLSGMFQPDLPVAETLTVAMRPVRDQVPAGVELSAVPTGLGHRILWQVPNCDVLVAQAHNVARNLASKYPQMSEHERAALVLYTMEDYPRENSPYFVMNRALRDKNRAAVRAWRDFIWLVMHGMRKIPETTDMWQLVRGCKNAPGKEYKIGQIIQWAAFSSTATNIGVMNEFVGTVGPRTLFQVRLLSPSYGRSLQDFSLFPDESEILLAPGCTFDVTSIFDAGNGLTMVQLQQVPSSDQILDLSSSAKPTNFQPTHAPCDPVPKQAAKPIIAPIEAPISSDWMNVVPYCLKEGLQDLHDQLYGNLGSSKNKQELVDAICSHSSGIAILKKVPVDALREILIHEAGLAPKDAKALKKEEIIEKLRRGELRVPAPKAAATKAAASKPEAKPTQAPAQLLPVTQPMPAATPAATKEAKPTSAKPPLALLPSDGASSDDASSDDDTTKLKPKRPKDPNAPKQPASAYILFKQAELENVRCPCCEHRSFPLVPSMCSWSWTDRLCIAGQA